MRSPPSRKGICLCVFKLLYFAASPRSANARVSCWLLGLDALTEQCTTCGGMQAHVRATNPLLTLQTPSNMGIPIKYNIERFEPRPTTKLSGLISRWMKHALCKHSRRETCIILEMNPQNTPPHHLITKHEHCLQTKGAVAILTQILQ